MIAGLVAALLAAPLLAHAGPSVTTPPGTYLRSGSTSKTTASIVIHEITRDRVVLTLEVIAKAAPESTLARTGELDRQELAIADGLATYREDDTGGGGCTLVFRLASSRIRVVQTGLCGEFGVGIDATGIYPLRKRAAQVATAIPNP
jgi:hypothetical protein